VAEDVSASLIIIGSRPNGTAPRALTGSVSENVVRRAGCPVVIAPDSVRRRRRASGSDNGRSVLVGVGSTEHTLAVVHLGRDLAAIFDDRLVLVHAQDEHSSQSTAVLREAHESAGPDATFVLAAGPAGRVLDRASDRENARLIVIGADDLQRQPESGESLRVQLSAIALCPIVVLPDDAPPIDLQRADADRSMTAAGRSR
jgi:nucleotide-binding universal stress UspA family protein